MFGILSRKGNDVMQYANSLLNISKEKEEDGWVLTSEIDVSPISDIQKFRGKASLIYCRKPLSEKCVFGFEGKMFNGMKYHLRMKGDLKDNLREMLQVIDGEYSLALTNGREIAVARDPLGRKPVFYAHNVDIVAFASNKRNLWCIGLKNVKPLRAGELAFLSENGIEVFEGIAFEKPEISERELEKIVIEYHKLLHEAVVKRLKGFRKVGVLLSGGVDSALLAKLVSEFGKRMGIEVIAYTAGTESAVDVAYAERCAKEMRLQHKIRRLNVKEVEEYIPRVIKAVEERDFIQIEAGIGVFAAEELAAQDNIEVIFSGQGPDEMWGGYEWYPRVVAQDGYKGFLEKSWGDLRRADIETLDRENKIAHSHGLEVVFPYVDTKLVELAMSVAPECKIYSSTDELGKHPHREVAKKAGVPPEFSNRGKDAAQHGTGVHDLLDQLAQGKGFEPEKIDQIGYRSEEISTEKLGSSARYGYKYSERSMWMIDKHIQFFFDVIAYGLGLLNDDEREKIARYINSFRAL